MNPHVLNLYAITNAADLRARYRLVELSLTAPPAGGTIDVEGETYEIARYGPSPLPGDARRCLYLVRGRRSASDGSS